MEKRYFVLVDDFEKGDYDSIEEALREEKTWFRWLCKLSMDGNPDAENYIKAGASIEVYDRETYDEDADYVEPVKTISCEEIMEEYLAERNEEEAA